MSLSREDSKERLIGYDWKEGRVFQYTGRGCLSAGDFMYLIVFVRTNESSAF